MRGIKLFKNYRSGFSSFWYILRLRKNMRSLCWVFIATHKLSLGAVGRATFQHSLWLLIVVASLVVEHGL